MILIHIEPIHTLFKTNKEIVTDMSRDHTVLVWCTVVHNLLTFTWIVHFELLYRLKETDKTHTEGLFKFLSILISVLWLFLIFSPYTQRTNWSLSTTKPHLYDGDTKSVRNQTADCSDTSSENRSDLLNLLSFFILSRESGKRRRRFSIHHFIRILMNIWYAF